MEETNGSIIATESLNDEEALDREVCCCCKSKSLLIITCCLMAFFSIFLQLRNYKII